MKLDRLTYTAVILATMLLTNGCALFLPDRIHYTLQDQERLEQPLAAAQAVTPSASSADVIGVALSGGGSRASVYGAAALEVLAEEGVLPRATYLSSVSGGGFPAAYYALNKPAPCPATDNAGPCLSESFAAFKKTMRHNFLSDMTLRQLGKPGRISSSTRRLSSLQDALERQITNGAVFGELPPTPVLLINGARYDDGRRFVFSNVAIPEADSTVAQFTNKTLRTASFSLPGCTRPTPPDFSLALAVAISAGFPPVLGPASIEAPETCNGGGIQYWHLGDGGILDNTGVETIEDFALRAEPDGPSTKRVIIFSVDAGRSTPSQAMMQTRNLKLWTSDPGRVVEIVGMRAQAYRQVALRQLRRDSDISVTTIKMRYTDAVIEEWPASCGDDQEAGAQAISTHLLTIPTSLKISDCDADLMELAARDVVRRTLYENAAVLESLGLRP
ncbi:MAG: patatin-like phospholipase family protein [Pseudomonadota bacterium]